MIARLAPDAERRLELSRPAGIRAHDYELLARIFDAELAVVIGEKAAHHRHGVEVIDGGVGPLNLSWWNSIERTRLTPAADSRSAWRGDRGSGQRLAVLPSVAIVGNHGGDVAADALEGVDHHQQLHQVIVGGCACALDQDVAAARGLHDVDVDLTVTKATHGRLSDGTPSASQMELASCGQPL